MSFLAVLLILVANLSCAAKALEPQYLHVQMRSASLTQFWGRPVDIEAYVLLPASYLSHPDARYPIIYWIPGFDGDGNLFDTEETEWKLAMRKAHQEFILVSLRGMFNGGHEEFADSVNNGPWGTALTSEFIPQTEAHFRAIGTSQTRFVGGHSSGGWSALWLQVNYPELFGGEWSLSPDPVDFHDFAGPDITRTPPQNFYRDPSGQTYGFIRERGRDTTTLEQWVRSRGWPQRQMDSFDAVFSPRGENGKPVPLFDRRSGAINPDVAAYWGAHYDIARLVEMHWKDLAPKLHGKIHIIVGAEDTFHLDGPVRLLKNEFKRLGDNDEEFDFMPGADHWMVFKYEDNVRRYIVSEATRRLAH